MKIVAKVRALFRRKQLDRDMAEEMRFHLEERTEDHVTDGMAPDDARAAAHRRFGGVTQITERCREQRTFVWLDQLRQDVRQAARQLRKSPGFAAVAVLSLALGIGANTALFSLINDVLLKSLPVREPDELVLFRWYSPRNALNHGMSGYSPTDPATGLRTSTSLSYFIFDRLRADAAHQEVLSDLFAFAGIGAVNLNIDNQAELASGQAVTGGYFKGLGVPALRGRTLGLEDDREHAPPVAMISHRFWRQRFGASETVVGKTIRINNLTVTVVGITPENFHGTLQLGHAPDITLPMALEPQLAGRANVPQPLLWWLHIGGRLRHGVTAGEAQARLEPPFVQAARDAWSENQGALKLDPIDTRANPLLRLLPGDQGLVEVRRSHEQPLRVLTCIVAVVLLIACTNVASLLLARAAGRTKEIAVRLSLGAGRGRLIRQLLTESLMLALLGGALGVLVAYWGRAALLALRPIAGAGSLALDGRVLGFTLGISVLVGAIFGLAPAWRATRVDLNSAMRKSTGGSAGQSRLALRRMLMVAQVALSLVLLAGAGLFVRTLGNLRSVEVGFNRDRLLLFSLDASLNNYSSAKSLALFDRVLERMRALPGVRAATLSRLAFLTGGRRATNISIVGRPLPSGVGDVNVNIVHPDFFDTMEIPVVLGRSFTARDNAESPLVAIVSQKFAETVFPGEHPIGQRFALGGDPTNRPLEIVGVTRDVRYADFRSEVPLVVFTAFNQEPSTQAVFAVRANAEPRALGPLVQQTLRDIDPLVPVFNLRTLEEQAAHLVRSERLFATLTTFFGAVALVLTCIGLYGLLANQVAMRTREIGIRMALGAQIRAVLTLVIGEGLRLVLIGVAVGLAVALGVTRFVAKMLFGIPPNDPAVLGGAGLLLIVIAAFAAWLPARRAGKVDPVVALRTE